MDYINVTYPAILLRSVAGCFIFFLATSLYSEKYSIELDYRIQKTNLTNSEFQVFTKTGLINSEAKISVNRKINFGRLILGIGIASFNYEDDPNASGRFPLFDPNDPLRVYQQKNSFLKVPIGLDINFIGEHLYLPVSIIPYFEIKNQTQEYPELWNSNFLGIRSGIGYQLQVSGNFRIAMEPYFTYFIDSTKSPGLTEQKINLGIGISLGYDI